MGTRQADPLGNSLSGWGFRASGSDASDRSCKQIRFYPLLFPNLPWIEEGSLSPKIVSNLDAIRDAKHFHVQEGHAQRHRVDLSAPETYYQRASPKARFLTDLT